MINFSAYLVHKIIKNKMSEIEFIYNESENIIISMDKYFNNIETYILNAIEELYSNPELLKQKQIFCNNSTEYISKLIDSFINEDTDNLLFY